MKHYFVTLVRALIGFNPFREELAEAKDEYKRTADWVRELEEMVYQLDERLDDAREDLEKAKNRIITLQDLAENLQERVREKDAALAEERKQAAKQISAMISGHEEDISEYEEKISNLNNDLDETLKQLQDANKALGRDCMCQVVLDKTNNGLNDLCAAILGDNEEEIRTVVEVLEWSNPLSRIAQHYLQVLTRKHELESRMK